VISVIPASLNHRSVPDKKRPSKGGQGGPGRRSHRYLLPQIVGETRGMRGGTASQTTESKRSFCVARGYWGGCSLDWARGCLCRKLERCAGYSFETSKAPFGCTET